MSGAIEDIAKKWLSEPAYTKVKQQILSIISTKLKILSTISTQVFKHTADVVEDYICYFLTAIGAIALSVRFLSSLGTGDLSCIIAGEM